MSDPKIVASVLVLGLVLAVGWVMRGAIQRMDLSPEQRRRTKNVVRYVMALVVLIGLAVVWAAQLQSAAIVASGFAVAIVLFNKDLVLSVLGWWMKTASGAYRIGDRIRVGEFRGDVIDYGVLSTTLMAVDAEAHHGMRTGNVITLPNALLLTVPVLNETRILGFEWLEVEFEVRPEQDWRAAEAVLMAEAVAIVDGYREQLTVQLAAMSDRFAFHPIQADPHVFIKPCGMGSIKIWVRLPLPARSIAVLADRLNRCFVDWSTQV
jgi:small-conductance mechanosensitive channel